MTDEKHGNPAFEQAQKLTMDDIEAAQLEEAMERAKQKKIADGPKIGSTERFLGAMQRGLQK